MSPGTPFVRTSSVTLQVLLLPLTCVSGALFAPQRTVSEDAIVFFALIPGGRCEADRP